MQPNETVTKVGRNVRLSPDAMKVLDTLSSETGVDDNSLILQAIIEYGKNRGIIPGVARFDTAEGPIPIGSKYDKLIDFLSKGNGKNEKLTLKELVDTLMAKKVINGLSNDEGGSGMNLKEMAENIMYMKMIRDMTKEDDDGKGNAQIDALKRSIEEINKRFELEQERRKYDELRQSIMQLMASKKGENDTIKFEELFKILAEKDKDIKEMEMRLQEEKERNLREMMEKQLADIQERIQQQTAQKSTNEQIAELSQAIKSIKEVASEFSAVGKPDKTKGELAKELIEGTIEKIKEPLLKPMGQAIASQIANQNQPREVIVQPTKEVVLTPQPSPETIEAPPIKKAVDKIEVVGPK